MLDESKIDFTDQEDISGQNRETAEKEKQECSAPDAPKASGSFVIRKRPSSEDVSFVCGVSPEELAELYPDVSAFGPLDGHSALVILDEAEAAIKSHIGWGRKTQANVTEQGGILIGRPYFVGGAMIGVAERIIPAELSVSNSAYLKMGTETWIKMLDTFDEQYRDHGLQIIGWFHTHPNNLPVFMSSTDMGTQRAFFFEEWHFSVVLNPHRRLAACFRGRGAVDCRLYPDDFLSKKG